jgi:hypothetical protein
MCFIKVCIKKSNPAIPVILISFADYRLQRTDVGNYDTAIIDSLTWTYKIGVDFRILILRDIHQEW